MLQTSDQIRTREETAGCVPVAETCCVAEQFKSFPITLDQREASAPQKYYG